MNKKGQTLVIFVILIPLLLIIAALIVDNSIIVYKNLELKNMTKEIINIDLVKAQMNDEDIKQTYVKNNIPVDKLSINREEESINIKNTYYVDSIFGKIINIDKYEVSVNVTGVLNNNRVIYK